MIFERIEVLNGAAAAAIYGSRANAGVIQIFTKRGQSGKPVVSLSTSLPFSELRKQVETNQSPVKFGGIQLILLRRMSSKRLVRLRRCCTNTTPVTRYNYQDYIFFSRPSGTDNTVSSAGGSDNTKFYTSLGYFSNRGSLKTQILRGIICVQTWIRKLLTGQRLPQASITSIATPMKNLMATHFLSDEFGNHYR